MLFQTAQESYAESFMWGAFGCKEVNCRSSSFFLDIHQFACKQQGSASLTVSGTGISTLVALQ